MGGDATLKTGGSVGNDGLLAKDDALADRSSRIEGTATSPSQSDIIIETAGAIGKAWPDAWRCRFVAGQAMRRAFHIPLWHSKPHGTKSTISMIPTRGDASWM